ncbi:MAG: tetratricopeptide repeat protein [Pseudomonadota bacterium]
MTRNSLSIIAIVLGLAHAAPPTAMAEESIGAYLAARQATFDNDYKAAAEYFTRALTEDPSNPAIMESAVIAQISLGRVDLAIPVSRKIEADGLLSHIAHMALVADDVENGRIEDVIARMQDDRGIGDLADGLVLAWAHLSNGDVRTALAEFDTVAESPGLRSFAIYHKALALASVGDFEAAVNIFSGESDGPVQRTRRGTIAHAEALSQLERNEEAVALLDDAFGGAMDPEIKILRDVLVAGDIAPFSMISSPEEGIAEVFYTLGRALLSETSADYVLLYSRVAEHLSPSHIDAVMMTAELLESLERYELATAVYKSVPQDHPSYAAAEMGRAESLRRAEKLGAAVEVLEQLARTHPELPLVHVSVGDMSRQLERFDDAVEAYDRAIGIYSDLGQEQWFVHYARAISLERLGEWPDAEAGFRKALELNPGHPQVMNYLGYSLVEKRIKLDEALDLIERAVAAEPNSGYIVDSLGWVLYRLGRYEEAVVHMERAAELMPIDPVVNDHLGDVLWLVGRYNEAEFQWRRALSLVDEENPSPDIDPDRIRRKLDVGLYVVLEDENADSLEVVDDGG